jgi:hypothetical protein
MMKRKAKKAAAGKKSAKKKRVAKAKKELNPAEVRKDIAKMVGTEATEMAHAVIEEGKRGQLASLKYLLELAKIFPAATDESQGTPEADCLAKTLLNRLNIPDVPIMHDENGELVKAPVRVEEKTSGDASDDAGKDSVLPLAEGKSS